ncbi:tRNA uridine-5-carboxymethylaminomethyl(34) synthesis GTPase MnmE [Babesia caballi]|uniref:tRNA uridine-5-carboxymethylaminomethyl(34) synthesis GTPase MnmE n=1 Tax=Babesia caballi TaxID=5871 RepID=A0AAV4LRG9_BABCB|nr:tRNA uridine-5-carboxymethylaminomethyl(34) synthesis GTPase MnmE [Babesia caballi]
MLVREQAEDAGGRPFKCVARAATLRSIYDPVHSTLVDKAVTIYFPRPNSFTGEDVVEIHTHGSRAVVSQLFEAFRQITKERDIGLRQAERGEFTRRAFYNGKVDLTQAEAIRDVIAAETKAEMQNAALKALREQLREVGEEIARKVEDSRGEILRSGASVAIVGPPNAGKSSLINAICGRRVAIVADMPGTTRDLVQAVYDLDGIRVTLVDTAGVRALDGGAETDSHRGVEMQGIEMALRHLAETKLAIFLFDHTNVEESRRALAVVRERLSERTELVVCVSKADLLGAEQMARCMEEVRGGNSQLQAPVMALSSHRPGDVEALLGVVQRTFAPHLQGVHTQPFITEARHKAHLRCVIGEIRRTLRTIGSGQPDLEIVAENMREAIAQIAYIVVRVDKSGAAEVGGVRGSNGLVFFGHDAVGFGSVLGALRVGVDGAVENLNGLVLQPREVAGGGVVGLVDGLGNLLSVDGDGGRVITGDGGAGDIARGAGGGGGTFALGSAGHVALDEAADVVHVAHEAAEDAVAVHLAGDVVQLLLGDGLNLLAHAVHLLLHVLHLLLHGVHLLLNGLGVGHVVAEVEGVVAGVGLAQRTVMERRPGVLRDVDGGRDRRKEKGAEN